MASGVGDSLAWAQPFTRISLSSPIVMRGISICTSARTIEACSPTSSPIDRATPTSTSVEDTAWSESVLIVSASAVSASSSSRRSNSSSTINAGGSSGCKRRRTDSGEYVSNRSDSRPSSAKTLRHSDEKSSSVLQFTAAVRNSDCTAASLKYSANTVASEVLPTPRSPYRPTCWPRMATALTTSVSWAIRPASMSRRPTGAPGVNARATAAIRSIFAAGFMQASGGNELKTNVNELYTAHPPFLRCIAGRAIAPSRSRGEISTPNPNASMR